MEYKACQTEVKEIDTKGRVVFYASVFNNKDLCGDIIVPGAFSKTLQENLKNIRHFKHHSSWDMPGVIKEIKEDNYGLVVTSDLILNTTIGKETYEQYKAMADAGKSMDHSIGYRTIKFDIDRTEPDDETRIIRELKLYEVSTLTGFGMNPLAQTVSVKENIDLNELLKEQKYFQILLNCKFTDAKLEQIEELKSRIDALVLSRKRTQQPQYVKGSEIVNSINFNLQ